MAYYSMVIDNTAPLAEIRADGDRVNGREAHTERPKRRGLRGSAGVHLRAWYARREASGTWETLYVPEPVHGHSPLPVTGRPTERPRRQAQDGRESDQSIVL